MMSLKSVALFFALVVNVVVAQPGFFAECFICPGGNNGFSNGGNVLNTGLSSYSCNEAQAYGNARELGDASCLIFQMYANRPGNLGCGCNTRVEFPVENLNPECDICGDGTKGIFPGTEKLMVPTTYLMEMPCEEIFEFSYEYFPQGSCRTFQNDVKDICCVENPESNLETPPTGPPPNVGPGPETPITPPVYQAPPPETFCGDRACSNTNPCCYGYKCMDDKCDINRPSSITRSHQRTSIKDSKLWGGRNLLRGVKEALTAQSGGY